MHGGSAPQVEAAAARRLALIAVQAELATIEPDSVDPAESMIRQLGLAAAWERFLRNEVAALAALDDHGIGGSRKAAVAVELWNDERDRVAKLAKLALDAGIAERQVQIAERQGALIADLIRKVLDDPDLALSASQRGVAGQVAARHLRELGEAS